MKREPFEVKVISLSNTSYSLEDMEMAFPPPPRAVYVPRANEYAKEVLIPPIGCLLEGNRHPALKETAGRMYAGAKQQDFQFIRQALKAWYSLSCVNLKNNWEREVDGVCDWVESREVSNV